MPEQGRIVVNGVAHEVDVVEGARLLTWLREELGLTGTKYACGESECGACTVLVDGALARACVTVLGDVVGHSVTTIEGLADDGDVHPVQRSFVDAGAMQCGFCTPGMVMAAVALLGAQPDPSDDEIAQWMHRTSAGAARTADPPCDRDCRRARPSGIRRSTFAPAVAYADSRAAARAVGSGLRRRPRLLRRARRRSGGGRTAAHIRAGHMVADRRCLATCRPCRQRTTAFTGKVEVGQGTRRALRIAVAAGARRAVRRRSSS